MMKKLNNKGFTTIEVILCFVLVVIITTSLYTTITSFNQKRITEEYKSKMYTYKNLLTKEIQDDILKKGLISAVPTSTTSSYENQLKVIFNFKDGTSTTLIVIWHYAKSELREFGDPSKDDYYIIKYGSRSDDELTRYPLPELGESESKYTHTVGGVEKPLITKDLSINDASCKIENNVLDLHIDLYHGELGHRYSINIVCPINYIDTGSINPV